MKKETANQKKKCKIYSSHYAYNLIQKHFPNEYKEVMEALAKFSMDQKARLEKLKEDLKKKGWKEMAVSIDRTAEISPVMPVEKQEGLKKTKRIKKNLLKTRIPFAKDHLALYILENRSRSKFDVVLEELRQLEDFGLIDFGILVLAEPEVQKKAEKEKQKQKESFPFNKLDEEKLMDPKIPSLVIFETGSDT